MKKSLARFRVEPRPGPPQDFAKFIASESKKWADVIYGGQHQGGVRLARVPGNCSALT